MSGSVVLLSGVPDFAPGLLFKIFLDIPGVEAFFRPLARNLDLIVKYSDILRGETGIPAGYFDSYGHHTDLFRNYPRQDFPRSPEDSLQALMPFLEDCRTSATRCAVFELSGCEESILELSQRWPDAKMISLKEIAGLHSNQVKYLSEESLAKDYISEAREILSFCGIHDYSKDLPCLNSDWLKLVYFRQGLEMKKPKDFGGLTVERAVLEKLLRQRKAILELGKQEVQIHSLEGQLKQMEQIAAERMTAIHAMEKTIDTFHRNAGMRALEASNGTLERNWSKIKRAVGRTIGKR